ncbi:GNAT family N-acetyltransferase [Brevibacillus nitrificans]|uniref:GNAT family N-acetyltransferase n=1 Tax=Brevibacillus nitrificans TaxID=651560 RepID=A0A3M8DLN4_9BACL|nr:GNAT family N-acetyltransferase [Brevibacillus nitrificans]RNB88924.1 GNAT family N-acetyltransferase [Brevibacillus nitrificans]
MEIRQLGPEDAQAFAACRLEALQKDPDAFGSTYEDEKNRTLEEWQERLTQTPGENAFFGAFEKGEIVGTIGFFRHKGRKVRHKGAIVSMYVREVHRGSGVAAGLMNAALDYIRGLGDVDQVQLAVVTTNPAAVRFYEKMGFQTYGFEKRALKAGERYFDETHMYLLIE